MAVGMVIMVGYHVVFSSMGYKVVQEVNGMLTFDDGEKGINFETNEAIEKFKTLYGVFCIVKFATLTLCSGVLVRIFSYQPYYYIIPIVTMFLYRLPEAFFLYDLNTSENVKFSDKDEIEMSGNQNNQIVEIAGSTINLAEI